MDKYEFKLICAECGEVHYHKCGVAQDATALRKAFMRFLTWVPEFGIEESVRKAMQKHGEGEGYGLEKGDDFTKFAFFGAQPWTYAMGGKHFGREFTGVIDRLIDAAGFDVNELRRAAYKAMDDEAEAKKKQEEGAAKHKKERSDTVKLFQSKTASLDAKIAVLDKVIASFSYSINPHPYKTSKGYEEDNWLSEIERHLKNRYEGGISPEINRLRIEHARKIATQAGIFSASFYRAQSFGETETRATVRRFQTREEMETALVEMYKPYDALSDDFLASAVCVITRERGNFRSRVQYARGPKGWIVTKDDRTAEAAE